MTQQKKKTAKKTASYSADNMMLRMVGGVVLIALGVLAFMACALGMDGEVFRGLKQVAGGLSGSLSWLLPAFPVWGGLLLLFSSWKKQPVRPLLFALGIFVLVETVCTLGIMTSNGVTNLWLMDHLQQQMKTTYTQTVTYQMFLTKAYELGAGKAMGGGVIGMLLAWPMWKMIGVILGLILSVLGVGACGVFLFRVDVKGLAGKAKSSMDERKQKQLAAQQEQERQQLAWQQEQQRLAMQQMQQQPVYYPPQPMGVPQQTASQQMPPQMPPQPMGVPQQMYGRPVTPTDAQGFAGFRAQKGELYTQATAEQVETGRAAYSIDVQEKPAKKEGKNSIFAKKNDKKHARLAPDPVESMEEQVLQPVEPVQPVQQVNQPMQQASAQFAPVAWEQPDPYSSSTWRGGEESWREGGPTRAKPVVRAAEEVISEPRQTTMELPFEQPAAPRRRKQQPKPSWEDTPPWEDAPVDEVAVPVVQMDTPDGAWKPDLKLPPRRERPEEEEEAKIEIPYVYPSMALLKTPEPASAASMEEDAILSRKLEEVLKSFKIPARVKHVTHGPRISRFELEIAAGITLNKITALDKNIAMNMEVTSVRIEAPIPGTNLVGVEVPNRTVATVTLREVLESQPMLQSKSPLTVAIGKDIAGKPIVCDLARMPHLLIAGATGSGKSVCINTMINSLLYRTSPKEVRLILIDPKVVELACYNGVPHLLIPVVNDPHKAAGALEWAVAEMEERYKMLSRKAVRNIDGYNAALDEGEEPMPRIVIVIDELADLMMVCKKDVEERICRIAQLARAAGIHLVVATQRPSVDVITGLIKANIPSRIAFTVSSYVDSRTVLDRPGAEKLLGYGDMLYLPNGALTTQRVQGCFLSDDEVNRITDFIRQNCPAEYDPNVIEQLESIQTGFDTPDMVTEVEELAPAGDNLLQQAIEMTVQDGQTSTSMLQRRLRIGYARAGRLVDEMEKRGIVSQKDGAKPRLCLISREELEQLKATGVLEE